MKSSHPRNAGGSSGKIDVVRGASFQVAMRQQLLLGRNNVADYFSLNVGQAEVATSVAESEALVI